MSTFRLTDTRLDVLRLIAEGRPLGDYVPRYRPGARRGRGTFPVTIAERAERDLRRAGLVDRAPSGEPVITAAGRQALASSTCFICGKPCSTLVCSDACAKEAEAWAEG